MRTRLFQRPDSIAQFVLRAVLMFVALTMIWSQVARFTSVPAAWMAQFSLEQWSRSWVRVVHRELSALEVETRIAVPQTGAQGVVAELVTDADAARHAYGLPLFLALLLAAGGGGLLRRALLGYGVLLLPQAFSTTMVVLRNIVSVAASARALLVDQWQVEAIALGYQLGTLLLPALAPIAVWLWFDRAFLAAFVTRVPQDAVS